MNRSTALFLALALAGALTTTVWVQRDRTSSTVALTSAPAAAPTASSASTNSNAHGDACVDCGHAISPTPSSTNPTVVTALSKNWADELRRQLADTGEVAALHSTLVDLIGRDAPRAMTAALAIARSPLERHDLAAMAAEIWGAIDPAAAWSWTRKESDALNQPDRDPVYAAALNGIASQKPDLVPSLVDALLAGPDAAVSTWAAPQLTQAALAALLKSGEYAIAGATLTRWHHELSAEKLEASSFAMVATAWSTHAPADTAKWLLGLPDSERRARGLESLASNWAEAAPDAALDWAVSLPAQTGRDTLLARAFERWVDQDSMAAAQWVAKHEAEPAADQMIHALLNASTVAASHPREAVQWAELIKTPELRLDALKNALHFWARADAPAALAFVETNTRLDEKQKSELRAIVRTPPAAAGQ